MSDTTIPTPRTDIAAFAIAGMSGDTGFDSPPKDFCKADFARTLEQLALKWIAKESALRRDGADHAKNGRFNKSLLANTRAAQLAKCRRELQEVAGMVVVNL